MEWGAYLEGAAQGMIGAKIAQEMAPDAPLVAIAPDGKAYKEGRPLSGGLSVNPQYLMIGAGVAAVLFLVMYMRRR